MNVQWPGAEEVRSQQMERQRRFEEVEMVGNGNTFTSSRAPILCMSFCLALGQKVTFLWT